MDNVFVFISSSTPTLLVWNLLKIIVKGSVDDFHPTYILTLQVPQQLFSVLRGPTETRLVLALWTIAGLVERGTTVTYWEWPVPQISAPRGTTARILPKSSQTHPPLTCVPPASTVPGVPLIQLPVTQVRRGKLPGHGIVKWFEAIQENRNKLEIQIIYILHVFKNVMPIIFVILYGT